LVSGNLGACIHFIPSTSNHRTGPSPTQNDLTLSHMVPSSLMILLGLCHKVKSHYTMNELAGYGFHLFSSFLKRV
jgi:hypothetical protein